MRKALIIVLALTLLLGSSGCQSSSGSAATKVVEFASSEVKLGTSKELSQFFDGDVTGKLEEINSAVCSFACALQAYPETLTSVPGNEFGWTFLYDLLATSGYIANGITRNGNTVTVTAEALSNIQKDVLGSAVWTTIPDTMQDYISYNEKKDVYTLKAGHAGTFGAYMEAADWYEEASCALLTLAVYDTTVGTASEQTVVARYQIALRTSETSSYGYIIAAFMAA